MLVPLNIEELFSYKLSPSMETPKGCDPEKSRVVVWRGSKSIKVFVKKHRTLAPAQSAQI